MFGDVHTAAKAPFVQAAGLVAVGEERLIIVARIVQIEPPGRTVTVKRKCVHQYRVQGDQRCIVER